MSKHIPEWLQRDPTELGMTKSLRRNILYHRQLALASPAWASKPGINAWYALAKKLGKEVDHIVPINHPYVCGLHCEANLQLLTPSQNLIKGNHTWPDSPFEAMDLFCSGAHTPEQYELMLD